MSGKDDKWEFYQDKAGEHRWRRTASNGAIVSAATEGFPNKRASMVNAERHGYNGNPRGIGRTDQWEFYTDKNGGHRWRRTSRSGAVVGSSAEAFDTAVGCLDNAERNGFPGRSDSEVL